MTKIGQHFSLEDFTRSDLAARSNINNSVPPELLPNLEKTVVVLEAIRRYLTGVAGKDIPVNVTSGYRCLALNRLLNSKDSSDHVGACAADIKAPEFGSAYSVAMTLSKMIDQLNIGQLIYEFDSWVHISWVKPINPANRVITINKQGVFVGVVK
jgi:zinc D-Ala-D-Ala carboxypeptidase